ncbi:ribonuclease P protein component [Candidatus Giovannonibacteria bacterium RIFCSPLOWO2_02_FULL_43_11b]|uniref:Ribonuclease P protein component n=1 Tax=Candidatus Giovannonibacteria bacterium RIFCSPHIGHO2_12_FULL_43_15 TaxID=1798341 RepID=A0A1F5WPE1_9BACT|nr:MAG: ribonuclease P protein component [Candidatus Giovannonibacteria bacterium RIFCSPHIGHO2_01_FULL_43_100]OGF66750.1 MAG: ribonuclease P protein component [Candidatus Giovannonibacteria bacterium RIFCSPHIGHO2_02_FULL_43_32]OGF77526.1 MAG: ribonuclease P protein component [Candidatus Giovannonibacteria bacterium RIFCSPHIGHO2_12_FULL_43_15]OGF78987.1 MAG: ribonuclease P protein component [Candidatus Giovannonibacteria bacterium RIFCSPLOWO2_01_FULL_43_60]OGF89970.1 MAG: ribonuclease P protein 
MGSEDHFYIRISKNNVGENRFIFIISGKIIKKAVCRNKIRRRAREILRKKTKDIKKGNDLTFIFKKGAEEQSYEALEREISAILEERRLIK